MYDDWPSLLKVIRGTYNCILVIITLQSAPACQTRLPSDSISKFISTLVLGNSSSSNISKNEYRFKGISVFTVDEVPRCAFRRAKPLL